MKVGNITVKDRHFSLDEKGSDYSELVTECFVGVDGDSVVIKYHETVAELNDCETCLMVRKDRVTMMRDGKFRTSMIFENRKRHISCYETPYGEIMIGIYTNALFIDLNENGGVINFAYTIDSSSELISQNELKITVSIKDDLV